ncbi:hypothetical protein, partial [Pseudomonas aeruginosa]|uniref:hypothetical protein n=2 Tax=Pseudomonas aeruginosa TaxID=287 RepID=UPI00223138C6
TSLSLNPIPLKNPKRASESNSPSRMKTPLTRVIEISQQKEILTDISINSKMKFIQTILTQFKLITDTNHFIQGPTYNGNRRTTSPSPAAQTNSLRQHKPPYKLAHPHK